MIAIIEKPTPITVTSHDAQRLARLWLESGADRKRLDFAPLRAELGRASIVDPQYIGANVVTMNSRVLCCINGGPAREITLVFPDQEDIEANRISVVTPVGAALLGLSEGQSISYEVPNGEHRTLTVARVTYQPEAHGLSEA
jgi:regulator of nucleoside diphosphate kinase